MNYKQIKGIQGEKIVSNILNQLDNRFTIKNNVFWLFGQIDHLVIYKGKFRKYVFVIETKNWGGKITGNSNCRTWKQTLNNKAKNMYNPIMQNLKHCKLIRFRYPFAKIFNIVVFIDGCHVRRRKNLIFSSELLEYIKTSV